MHLSFQVYKAKRAALLKLADSGFEDKVKARKKEKRKLLKSTQLLPKKKAKQL